MGRTSKGKGCVADHPLLFDNADIPSVQVTPEKNFRSLTHPLWTENKARLIQEYIKLFTYITKHGAYVDGFAAPQRRERMDLCSAKLVLEAEPKRVRDFWLCDIDPKGITLLNALADSHRERNRRINVVPGDFNETVSAVLASGRITEKTATFALLDQRTFECRWATVEQLARHKTGTKIEIFYFLATGWLDRSIAAVRRPETAAKLAAWWGRADWRSLQGKESIARAKLVAARFKDELGYKYAYPYPIHDQARGGRTMYHMIHATDHPEASPLMIRAYRKISGRSEIETTGEQIDLDTLWEEIQEEGLSH
jgi:three-Cys-motif partner protein